MHQGTGTVSSFGTGVSTTAHAGSFTNTAEETVIGPIFVLAALAQQDLGSVALMDAAIKSDDIPTNVFFFIPTIAYASWYDATQGGAFWVSLPSFSLLPGKTYNGYYVPLTALPPFGSRAEIGTIAPTNANIDLSSFFYFSAAYFNTEPQTLDDRLAAGALIIDVEGGDALGSPVKAINANMNTTFTNLLYTDINNATPTVHCWLSGVTTITQDGATVFLPKIKITNHTNDVPKLAIPGKNIDKSGRHGLDTIGNSGYTNNRDIPLDSVITKKNINNRVTEIRFGDATKSIAGIDYLGGKKQRVNVYLAG